MAPTSSIPSESVTALYAQKGQPQSSADFDLSASYQSIFEDAALLSQVPLLTPENASQMPDGSLVRLQAMVQDMADPQYYHGAIRLPDGTWVTTKYQDGLPPEVASQVSADLSDTRIWERRPFLCVPLPGRSAWTVPQNAAAGSAPGAAPAAPTTECVLYVYDKPYDASLCLLDTVDVLGWLSVERAEDPWRADTDMETETHTHTDTCGHNDAKAQTDQTTNAEAPASADNSAPAPKVVAIHAVAIRRNLPLYTPAAQFTPTQVQPAAADTAAAAAAAPAAPQPAAAPVLSPVEARGRVLQLLSQCLGGDSLAAEYLLLTCLSRVVSRPNEGSQSVVGPLPLNLTHTSTTQPAAPAAAADAAAAAAAQAETRTLGRALHACLSALLPLVSSLPLTVKGCNEGWRPTRDPVSMKVSRSPLQLPRGCVLLIDELSLSEGKLTETGVKSLQALQGVLLEQGKSLMGDAVAVRLPLVPDTPLLTEAQVLAAVESLGESTLSALRDHLSSASQAPYEIPDDMAEALQSEFVRGRKGGAQCVSPEDFQQLLTVARLMAVSAGETRLTPQRWQAAKDLERRRTQRVKMMSPLGKAVKPQCA